ncbi:MAG: hypothetical protein J6R01_08290 [Alistipes sp.]|nr:hypothetical protein [Alistipes sp.]
MGFFNKIKGWFNKMIHTDSKEIFNVAAVSTPETDAVVQTCAEAYRGFPRWADKLSGVKTINFAKSLCSETARLTTLAIDVTVDGSARADWINNVINQSRFKFRYWCEYACAYGTIVLKPSESTIDVFLPGDYIVTDCAGDRITGAVFRYVEYDAITDKWYTRLEHHRIENDMYSIVNRCFVSSTERSKGKPIEIEATPWVGILEEVEMQGVDGMLFAVLRTPSANNLDVNSPLGLPFISDALSELEALDVAWSRNAEEIHDSGRIVMLDSARLNPRFGNPSLEGQASVVERSGLPKYVRLLEGDGVEDVYHEINPQLNTEMRLTGINALLSEIGFKCGFSNGYFVFNESTGVITATQVEADDRRTIQLIKDMRDRLEDAVGQLVKAFDVLADLYNLAPSGAYDVVCDFGDITYNREEDRARYYGFVRDGRYPFWKYLVEFEGFSEDDAKQLEEENKAANKLPLLFGEE